MCLRARVCVCVRVCGGGGRNDVCVRVQASVRACVYVRVCVSMSVCACVSASVCVCGCLCVHAFVVRAYVFAWACARKPAWASVSGCVFAYINIIRIVLLWMHIPLDVYQFQ